MKGMRKMKRGMALLLALIMAFGASFVSKASVQEVQAATVKGIFDKQEDIVNYGNELRDLDDTTAFQIYNALRTITTATKTLEVEFDPALKIQEEVLGSYLSKEIQMALDAFKADYPEIFWIDDLKSRVSYTGSPDASGNVICTVTKVIIDINVPESYGNLDEAYDAVYKKLTECVSSAAGLSVDKKLKLYHDFLCEQLAYQIDAPNAHDMYGALIGGNCVCEGYAESFKALCDLSGIPCVLVVGNGVTGTGQEAHMWNYCLVDDKWYAVDVTWDDQKTQIFDEYFLAGSETKTPHFKPDVFGQSHMPDGDFSKQGYHTFTYPTLNSTAYGSSEEPGPSDPVEPGPSDPVEPGPSDPSKIKEGDVNGDGSIGAADALMVLQAAAQIIKLEDISYADVNKDGNVTAADALQILQYAAKIIQEFETVK